MTATNVILTALRASTLPVEYQAFLASISEGEGTIDFNTLYSGGNLANASDASNITMVGDLREWTGPTNVFPTWAGATTGQLISTAAGFCQDTHTTWFAYASRFNVTDFTPQSQISFNIQLAELAFGTRMGANLLQVLQAGETAMINTYLVGTWPGGASSSFPSRYVANLAALQAAPQPQVTEVTVPVPAELTDGSGNPITILLTSSATKTATAAAALAALISATPTASIPSTEPLEAATISSVAPVATKAPKASDPTDIFSSSTFKFEQGKDGLIIVPLARKGG